MTDLLRHPDDDLSAYLDGELTAAEAEAVYAHVVACADCSAELDAVRASRVSLRTLPAVEPPPGFLERLLATEVPGADRDTPGRVLPFRSRRAVLGNAAAAVAAGLFLVVGSAGTPATAVAPEVSGAVEQHSSSLSTLSVGLGAPRSVGRPLPGPFVAPAELAGYRLVDTRPAVDGLHLLYRKGPYALSVFEQRGRLDRGDLPPGGSSVEVGGDDAWHWGGRVLVLQRGDLVVTLVGDESADVLTVAAEGFPGGRATGPSWGSRLQKACGDALEMLSPAG